MEGVTPHLWLRPATDMETFFDCANKKGLFVTAYEMTLCSVAPIEDEQIKEALLHLFRKVPTLRLCFRKHEDILWACDMNREEIDFQVTETKDPFEVVEALLYHKFPTNEGPLWCARLLPPSASGKCLRPELKASFPQTRSLILANHHGIADGTTNLRMVNLFLHILDDVLGNRPIDDSIQLGELSAGEESKAILMAKVDEMRKNEAHFKEFIDTRKSRDEAAKLIPQAYPMAQDPNYKPQVALFDLDKETTKKFLKKCKQERVTVNSGLTALFNVALVDFVEEGGLSHDTYHIRELHSVNMRRYWSGDTSRALGCHMLILENIMATPAKWQNCFWEYARSIHANLVKGIQAKDAVTFLIKEEGSNIETFEKRPYPESDYGIANLGNLDLIIPAEGDHVRLTYLLRATSCWNDPMYHMYHTLRGCLIYCLAYANDILTRENAQKLVHTIFDNMKAVMH